EPEAPAQAATEALADAESAPLAETAESGQQAENVANAAVESAAAADADQQPQQRKRAPNDPRNRNNSVGSKNQALPAPRPEGLAVLALHHFVLLCIWRHYGPACCQAVTQRLFMADKPR